MEVTKVETTRDYALFGSVRFKGSIFYISPAVKLINDTVARSDVYDDEGVNIGSIMGHWFHFADKTLFKEVLL